MSLRATVLCLLPMMLVTGAARTQESPVNQRGTLELRSIHSQTLGRDIDYTAYLPPRFDAGSSYPLVYLLHGRGDNMAAWRAATEVLDRLIIEGAIPPLLAIMPDAIGSNRAGYYVDSRYRGSDASALPADAFESAFFTDLLPEVEASFPVVSHRGGRAVAGYSMGGYGAIRYLLAHADLFSAAIVLSPAVYTPLPPQDSSTRAFGAFGNGSRLFDAERYRELNYPALLEEFSGGRFPSRVFIAVGDDEWKHTEAEDALHDLDIEAHLLFNRLARVNGIQAEFRVYDGGHDWQVWKRGFEEGLRSIANHLRLSVYR